MSIEVFVCVHVFVCGIGSKTVAIKCNRMLQDFFSPVLSEEAFCQLPRILLMSKKWIFLPSCSFWTLTRNRLSKIQESIE